MNAELAKWRRFALLSLLLTTTYVAAGKLGLLLAFAHGSATAVWPPTGIALAAFLLWGNQCAPVVFVAAFLVNFTTPTTAGDWFACLGIALGNTLESFVGAALVQGRAGGVRAFRRPRDFFAFVLLAALASTAISATIGTTMVLGLSADRHKFQAMWFTWWLGDAVGALVVTPCLVLWAGRPWSGWDRRRLLEAVGTLACLVLVGQIVFGPLWIDYPRYDALDFVCFPILVWVAFRLGPVETATGNVLLATLAIWGTLQYSPSIDHDSLLLLQAFLGVAAVTALAVAVEVADHRRTEQALRHVQEGLEHHVRERTTALAQSEERFRGLLESGPDAVIIVNELGQMVLVNAQTEKLFGYDRWEILGQKVEMLIPERFRAQHTQHRTQYFQNPAARPMGVGLLLFGLRKGDQEFPIEISLSPMKAEEGVLVSAAIRDISARQEMETKLRQAERLAAIGEMMTGLAHESRNALQQSQACLELMGLKVQDQPSLRALVSDVQKAQDQLSHLYEKVRSYAAPIVLESRATHLGKLIEEVWAQLAHLQKGRKTRLVHEARTDNLVCTVDRRAMSQLFRNLLENSLAACADPVEILVCWCERESAGRLMLGVSIRDNGPGLTSEARRRLFEPFFTTKTQGTGLGLAIARRIAEAHHGTISVGPADIPGTEIIIHIPRQGP